MFENVKTPCYIVDEAKIKKNLEILRNVEKESGAHILLAQKAFSMFSLYPLIGQYISGTTASGLYEAKLGYEEMGKENHVYAPAYKPEHMEELVRICDHIIFNSFAQYDKYREIIQKTNEQENINAVKLANEQGNKERLNIHHVSAGIRINPMCSTQEGHEIYDPCAFGSRLGVTRDNFREDYLFGEGGIEGLHVHTLCEQNSDALVTTFKAVEEHFGEFLYKVKWLNLGGGHHITRSDYDIKALVELVRYIRSKYDVEVYLEPGEAIALNAGYLVTEVMDKVKNGMEILILDASAACHMPDVLEMPYRPPLRDGFEPNEKEFTYRLSSLTCLAGDVIGDYSFEKEINVGDRLIFEDMAIYSMVKNNTFNGIPLPDILLLKEDGTIEKVKSFGYEDFKERLS
ncbi:MAG: carboxynorspermidine decarboxylase [Lachnospiraceae bacterium]|nr:carboxynorspermidine decarboxylase [Lachnospiraceae bacterium]